MLSKTSDSRSQSSSRDRQQERGEPSPLPQQSYVDVLDSRDVWKAGKILEYYPVNQCYRIVIEQTRHEEIISVSSVRLARFRSESTCGTATKSLIQKSYYKFSLADHAKRLEQLRKFIARPLNEYSPFEVVQLIRGTHYYYTDFLLHYQLPNLEVLKAVQEYFQAHLALTSRYMNDYDTTFQKYWAAMYEEDTFPLVELEYALAFQEIFQLATTIVNDRSVFIRQNKALIQQHLDISGLTSDAKPESQQQQPDTYVRLLFSASFFRNGGVDHFDKLIKGVSAQQQASIPFDFLRYLFGLYNALDRTLNSDIRQKYRVATMLDILQRNVERMKDQEVKNIHYTRIFEVVRRIIQAADNSYNSKNYLIQCDTLHLDVLYRYLTSVVFQAKKDACDWYIEYLARLLDHPLRKMVGIDIPPQLSPQMFFDWFQRRKILEHLMGDCSHPQIFRRGADIVKLLCRHRLLNVDILRQLWQARVGKHDEIIRIIYQTITNIAEDPSLPENLLGFLMSLVQSVNFKDWDEYYLCLITELYLRLAQAPTKSLHPQAIYNVYYYYVQNNSPKALQSLEIILAKLEHREIIDTIFKKCLLSIQNNDNTPAHIKLLKCIAQPAAQLGVQFDQHPIAIMMQDIKRNAADNTLLGMRLDLLLKLLEVYPTVRLSTHDVKEMWDMTIRYPASFESLLKHLIDDFKPQKQKENRQSIISKEVRNFILFELIGAITSNQATCSTMSPSLFEVFQTYFRIVNIEHKALQAIREPGRFLVCDSKALKGLDLLWNIYLMAEESISYRALEFLIDLHTKISFRNQNRRDDFANHLIHEALNRIRVDTRNTAVVNRCIEVLRKLMERVEKKYVEMRKEQGGRPRSDSVNKQPTVSSIPLGASQQQAQDIVRRRMEMSAPTLPLHPPFEHNYVKKELSKHMGLLLPLLETDSASKAWKIVSQLPCSDECEQLIEKLDQPFGDFYKGSIYYELYLLQIIQKKKSTDWWDRFIAVGGISTLVRQLELPMVNNVEEYYMVVLLGVLSKYYVQQSSTVNIKQVCASLLSMMDRYFHYLQRLAQAKHQLNPQECELQRKVVNQVMCITNHSRNNSMFINHPSLPRILRTVLVYSDNQTLKRLILTQLLRNFKEFQQEAQVQRLMLYIVTDLFEEVVRVRPFFANIYFMAVCNLMDLPQKANINRLVVPNISSIFQRLVQLIRSEPAETSFEDGNDIIGGCLGMLAITVLSYTERLQKEQLLLLFQYVLQNCLFEFRLETGGSKCKNEVTRKDAFKFVGVMLERVPESIGIFVGIISALLKQGYWRTRRPYDWEITSKVYEKSQTGYVGIDNPGCICYMSSFFQQMYMIPSLRQAIFEAEDPQYTPATEQSNLLYQLKVMFAALQLSEEESIDPRNFCEAFKDTSGNPINIFQQMDVDEFTNILFDRLEGQMKGGHNFINQHFGGVIANEIICRGCPHSSEKEEPFLSLSLEVKNKRYLYQSLQALVKGEPLDGDNAYQCDICKKKVSATKRVSLKKLPNHLIIVLKRIEFNYDSMSKIKINDLCQFPMRLDLRSYSQQHLHQQQGKNPPMLDQMPDDYYQYELKGTVIHMGFADAGHYYSLIRQRDGNQNWFEFNDSVVKPFNVDRIAEEAFGADLHGQYSNRNDRRKNSYILIYDRTNLYNQKNVRVEPLVKQPVYRHCQKARLEIKRQNESLSQRRIMFSKSMLEFFQELLKQLPVVGELTADERDIFRSCLFFYFAVMVRHSQRTPILEMAHMLIEKMNAHRDLAVESIAMLNHPQVLKELLMANPITQKRKLLANVVVAICEVADSSIHFPAVKEMLMTSILIMLTENEIMNFEVTNQLYMVLYKLARDNQRVCQFLLGKETMGRCIEASFLGELKSYQQFDLPLKDISDQLICTESEQVEMQYAPTKKKNPCYRTYMWGLFSQLLKHCDLGKPNLNDTATRNHKLSARELNLLRLRDLNMQDEPVTKFTLRKLSEVVATVATDDKEQTCWLLKEIKKILRNSIQSRFRTIFAVYKRLVQISDDLMELKLEALEDLIKITADEEHFTEREISCQYILKVLWVLSQIVRKNSDLLDYLHGSQLCQDMIQITHRNMHTDHGGSRDVQNSSIQIAKAMHQVHRIRIPRPFQAFKAMCERRTAEWQKIYRNEPIGKSDWDSDDDLADQKDLQLERVISYQYSHILQFSNELTSSFQPATIKSIDFDQLVLISEQKPITLWKDSELLAQQNVPSDSDAEESEFVESSSEQADYSE